MNNNILDFYILSKYIFDFEHWFVLFRKNDWLKRIVVEAQDSLLNIFVYLYELWQVMTFAWLKRYSSIRLKTTNLRCVKMFEISKI